MVFVNYMLTYMSIRNSYIMPKVLVLVMWTYTKAVHDAASVYAFPWMGPKSIISSILIVRSFTFRTNHDLEPIF